MSSRGNDSDIKRASLEKLQLSLAGKVDVQSPVDVIYWINQHLLWPYTMDSLTQYLKLQDYSERRSGKCRIRLEWAEWED